MEQKDVLETLPPESPSTAVQSETMATVEKSIEARCSTIR